MTGVQTCALPISQSSVLFHTLPCQTRSAAPVLMQETIHPFPPSTVPATAWLYGEGKNFVKTMLRLAETHDEVSVVSDQLGSPTSAVELAKMIHYLEPTENYGVFHATCEGDTNWAEFAEAIFKRAGKNTKVNHVTSEQYAKMNPASANRPAYSILDNYMLRLTSDFRMADWQDALDVYMKTLDF